MAKKNSSRHVKVTSFSMKPTVLKKGQQRAKELNRSFSNYMETLITQDVSQATAATPAAMT